MSKIIALSQLPLETTARIHSLLDSCPAELKRKLLALGFVKGTPVSIIRTAPLGCPIEVALCGERFSLRRQEAAFITIHAPENSVCL